MPKRTSTYDGPKLSPLKAIRAHCLTCCNGSAQEVRLCSSTQCPSYPYRSGKKGPEPHRPLKAIRQTCLDCLGKNSAEVRDCATYKGYAGQPPCTLWPFRKGQNPNITQETRDKLSRIAKNRSSPPSSRLVLDSENDVLSSDEALPKVGKTNGQKNVDAGEK